MADEKDTVSASSFLIVLLDSIERWALKYQTDSLNGQITIFWKSYQELLGKNVSFPSQAIK